METQFNPYETGVFYDTYSCSYINLNSQHDPHTAVSNKETCFEDFPEIPRHIHSNSLQHVQITQHNSLLPVAKGLTLYI